MIQAWFWPVQVPAQLLLWLQAIVLSPLTFHSIVASGSEGAPVLHPIDFEFSQLKWEI